MMPKSARILLVEDNSQDEQMILRVLVARDGQQALDSLFGNGEFAGAAAEPLAVILLDIGLPRVSGLEVLARVRAEPRTVLVPIVILTSSDDERDRLRVYQSGANSFVRKPVDFAEFVVTVSALGACWALTNSPPTG